MAADETRPNAPDDAAPADRRGEIVTTAAAMFISTGYAATSMSMLADACGIQKASLYHHFPSKQALFLACVTQGYDAAIARLRSISEDQNLDIEQRFTYAMHENYRTIVDSPLGKMSPLIAEVSLQFPDIARTFHDDFILQQHDIMNAIIDDGVADGVFARHDRLGLEHLIFGPIVTLALSRNMFAELDSLETHFPVRPVRDSHCDLLLKLLKIGASSRQRPAPG